MDKRGNFIFFYHEHDENGYLSNWYPTYFQYAYKHYFCTEQYMMAQKAQAFGDHESLKRIMDSQDPAEIKQLGRGVKNFDSDTWDKIRYQIMRRGIRAKFQQNPALLRRLLDTGTKVLVEASPTDRIWGIHLPESDNSAVNIHEWQGKNLLGRVLMQVRTDLRIWKKSGDISYKDYKDMDSNPVWQLNFIQAMQIPAVREIVSTYVRIVDRYLEVSPLNRNDHSLRRDVDGSIADFFDVFFDNMGGGYPLGDVAEMFQDLYDMTRFDCI